MSGKYLIVNHNDEESAVLFDFCSDRSLIALIAGEKKIVSTGRFTVRAKPTKKDPQDISVDIFEEENVRKSKDEILIKAVLRREKRN